ncbi:MAG: hypothetical protein IAG13_25125 [Deltaproteobacteria bacterium]|nr:hypothetical protein [Nannocystaceae bacterium]
MTRQVFLHLTARVPAGAPDLTREDTGAWLWDHLRAAFPSAVAAVLMPDHPHLIVPSTDPAASAERLARLLGHFGRVFAVAPGTRVATPEPIRSRAALARQIRYVALNPCRAKRASCPLAWPWSTHRDVVGAVVDPWVSADRIARVLDAPAAGFARRHHAYVSGDPDAEPDGTPFPRAVTPIERSTLPTVSLRTLAEAVSSAHRTPLAALRRRGHARALFVALAFEQGWDHAPKLADVCRCSPRTIRSLAIAGEPARLRIARLCLGDPRLRVLPPRAATRGAHPRERARDW